MNSEHLFGDLTVRLVNSHVRSLLAEDDLLRHNGHHVGVHLLDEGIRIKLGSELLVIITEYTVIDLKLARSAALGLAQASEDLRLGSFALGLPERGVEEEDESVDFFGRELGPLEVAVLGKGRNLDQPAGVFPVMDSAGESESLEEHEDRFSVSSQLNLKALINFYLPLRGL